ncbi:MAG: trehalose-phosphatase [Gemmatimonadaceae bacterium]|nr:trehalose-phosphatase [Gemmatimonadaceae bacterium]
MDALEAAPRGTARVVDDETWPALVATLREAPALRLLLDYDGTLVPFSARPGDAAPDDALRALLSRVAARPNTEVHLVSGRRHEELAAWFGDLDLGLHGEHGLWSRPRPHLSWRSATIADPQALSAAIAVLERFAARVPGVLLERKSAGMAWHWRGADPEVAGWQARELYAHLRHELAGTSLSVLPGDHVIEVRPSGVHKGRVAAAMALEADADTLFVAIGDDVTDVDLFAGLPPNGVAIAVGPRPAGAQWRVSTHAEVRRLLEALAAPVAAPRPPARTPVPHETAPARPSWWRRLLGGRGRVALQR